MVWVRLQRILSGLTLLVGLAVVGVTLHQLGFFVVEDLKIQIASGGSAQLVQGTDGAPEMIRKRIDKQVSAALGLDIWKIDLERIEAIVRSEEWIEAFAITRVLPNRIQLRIQTHRPLAVLHDGKKFRPVVQRGQLLSSLPSGQAFDLPLLRGERFAKRPEARGRVVDLLSQLPNQGALRAENISEIRESPEEHIIMSLIEPVLEVRLGADQAVPADRWTEHLLGKAVRVNRVVEYLSQENLRGRVIDATYGKKVLVRLRKGP